MKKMYENPIVEVLELEDADITTTSGGGVGTDSPTQDGNEGELNPGESWWG